MRIVKSLIIAALMAVVIMVTFGCGKGGSNVNTAPASPTYSVSGTVTSGGSALSGVTVTLSGSVPVTATTDSSGNYSFSGVQNGSYLLTPGKSGYTFSPSSQSVTVSGANLTGINFTATAITGTVQLPKSGQTVSYAAGDDGELQKGVAWPATRFTDNSNGSITDNLTGLVWLKDANCFGLQSWTAALASSNALASGACGLSDGSIAGEWRLPNISELESLVDVSQVNPAIPAGHPFTSVQLSYYWTSSSFSASTGYGWVVGMDYGNTYNNSKTGNGYVWPVRAGQ